MHAQQTNKPGRAFRVTFSGEHPSCLVRPFTLAGVLSEEIMLIGRNFAAQIERPLNGGQCSSELGAHIVGGFDEASFSLNGAAACSPSLEQDTQRAIDLRIS